MPRKALIALGIAAIGIAGGWGIYNAFDEDYRRIEFEGEFNKNGFSKDLYEIGQLNEGDKVRIVVTNIKTAGGRLV